MPKKYISYGVIFKRSSCLNTPILESKSVDAGKRFTNLQAQLNKIADGSINPSVKNSLRSFIESLCDYTNANKYYKQPLYCIQEFNNIDKRISNEIINDYTSRILPYVENLSLFNETINRYDLTPDQKNKILEAVNQYKVADRVLLNHDKISKRFNIELEVSKIKSKGFRNIVESCCRMIDTYTIKPYQKLNLCIEEMTYLLNKNGIKYDPKDLVSYALEYYLINSDNLSAQDIRGYQMALSESYCLEEEDLANVQYIYQNGDNQDSKYTSIKTEIENFLKAPNKTIGLLEIAIGNIFAKSTKLDVINHFDKIIWLIWELQSASIIDQGQWFDINTECFFDRLVRYVSDSINGDNDQSFTRDDIGQLITNIEKVKNVIIVNADDDYEYMTLVSRYHTYIDNLIEKLKELQGLVYSESNIANIEFVNSDNSILTSVNEFKIFKFNNLVKASLNLDKFLKLKAKNIYTKGRNKVRHTVRRIKDILFENSNIYDYIGEDGKVDICVAQYYFDESFINNIHEEFDNICKEYNNRLALEGYFTYRAYYIINPGILEVHIKDSTSLSLTEEDKKLISSSHSPALDAYIEEFAMMQAVMESYENFSEEYKVTSVKDKLSNFAINNNLTIEHYKLAMEALSLLGVSKEDVELFTENFSNYLYSKSVSEYPVITESEYNIDMKLIKNISDNWVVESNVPLDVEWEAYQILSTILEDAPKVEKPKVGVTKPNLNLNKKPSNINLNNNDDKQSSSEDNKEMTPDQEKEFKKNPFKGININSIRLYLEGLKGKMKDMSQKEKEMSRNIDNGFRRFVKSMRDALISDRREAIIKGSVIPSFSKCIKIAIGLAGTGLITGNPAIPLIIALGGFAMSKRLTKRERLLLLDEIETELEVVEKEISMAESKNQIKKYRTLLKYKKDLQRQYQRIRYNIRVGKDILPGSTAGIKDNLS